MQILTIGSANIDREHICCAIGNDQENTRRAQTKKDWLKDRFAEGLVFKRLDARPTIFRTIGPQLNPDASAPRFADHVKNGSTHADKKGFTFVFSNQCPFMEDYGGRIYAEMAQKRGFETHVIHLKSYEDAQRLGSPFGTFGLWHNGVFQRHDLITEAKFELYLDGII